MPGTADRPRMQSAKAPTPGSTMRSASTHDLGIGGGDDLMAGAVGGARQAFAAEARLPEP